MANRRKPTPKDGPLGGVFGDTRAAIHAAGAATQVTAAAYKKTPGYALVEVARSAAKTIRDAQAAAKAADPQRWQNVRRQTFLNAHGYRLAVDGIWGPKSQSAWASYHQAKAAAPTRPVVPLTPKQADHHTKIVLPSRVRGTGFFKGVEKIAHDVQKGVGAAEKAAYEGRVKQLAEQKLQAQQKHVTQLAQRLSATPEDASHVSLHDVSVVLIEKVPITTTSGAKIAQSWLATHGYKVQKTGVYDSQTHDLLLKAYHDAQEKERARQVEQVTHDVYDAAGLQPGDRPYWWPAGPAVPKPGELLTIIQGSGPYARLLSKAISKNVWGGQVGFDSFRHAELLKAALKASPTGSGAFFEKIAPGFATDFSLYADLNYQLPPHMSEVGGNSVKAELNRKALKKLDPKWRDPLRALYTAKNMKDYQAKLNDIIAAEEAKATAKRHTAMGHFYSAIGGALHYAFVPGVLLTTAITYEAQHVYRNWAPEEHRREEMSWNDASVVMGKHVVGYDGPYKPAHGWAPFMFKLIVDPINFVAPLRLASSALRFGGAGAMGRYVIKDSADSVLARHLRRGWEPGTWSRYSVPRALALSLPHGYAALHSPTALRLHSFGMKMAALKPEVLAKARRGAVLASRHQFDRPQHPVAGETVEIPSIKPKYKQAAKDRHQETKATISVEGRYAGFVQAVIQNKAAVYLDAAHSTPSSVGATMIGRYAEESRIQVIHRAATDAKADFLRSDAAQALSEGQREAGASAIYQDVLGKTGAYITGGVGDAKFMRMVNKQVADLQSAFENSVLPAIHALVVDAEAAAGRSLYDEAGLWVGRDGVAQHLLRSGGREAFHEKNLVSIPNPSHGVAHNWDEASDAIADEIRRATNRLQMREARTVMGGFSEHASFDLEARVTEEKDKIVGAWKQAPDGKYYDSRETVKVPDIYVRQHAAAFGGREINEALDNPLADLAADPTKLTDIDRAFGALVWDLGGRRAESKLGEGAARTFVQLGSTSTAHAIREEQFIASQKLRSAVTRNQIAVGQAYDATMSKLLAKDGALWMAMSHAQSWPMRNTYRALSASLDMWIFLTLPLRPGWLVRNVVDNISKSIIEGVRDPRLLYQGFKNPGRSRAAVSSIFDMGIGNVRYTIEFLDKLFHTNALKHFDRLLDHVYTLPDDALHAVFNAQGVDVSEAVISGMRQQPFMNQREAGPFIPHLTPKAIGDLGIPADYVKIAERLARSDRESFARRSRDFMWKIMGTMPEDFSKRILYRSTVMKTMKQLEHTGLTDVEKQLFAQEKAIEVIERTLFDYSKVTVIEDNFRFFLPFIQFWRKNTQFWIRNSIERPWLPVGMQKWEDARRDGNVDWPRWMRRYVSAQEIIDAAAVIPGLQPIVRAVIPDDGQFDPMSFSSFSRIYRAFKNENPDLPPDQAGMRIIGPMLDALQSYGPGLSPLVRKPLENAGVASQQNWQTVFPQFGPAIAMTRDFWMQRQASPYFEWARQIGLLGMGVSSDRIAADYDYWVNAELTGQAARGEQRDLAKAKHTIDSWFLNQSIIGYFSGVYWRRANPQDIYLSKMWEDLTGGGRSFDSLTPREDALMKMWKARKMDRMSFDQYVSSVPTIQAYYRQPTFEAKEAFKQAHPEIMQYVESKAWMGGPTESYISGLDTALHNREFFAVSDVFNSLDVSYDVKQAAVSSMVTPEMKKTWDANDTPKQIRDKMVQGEIHRRLHKTSEAYFAIPSTDFEARRDYLAAHPELVRSWAANNSQADDFGDLLHGANASLREHYFELADAAKWDEAQAFTRAHPFLWEDTKHASHYDPTTGQKYIQYQSAHARAYQAAKPALETFFSLLHRVGKDKAFAWLYASDSAAASQVKQYFRDWPSGRPASEHSKDYVAAKPALDVYFAVAEDKRPAWLKRDDEQAKAVLAYFDKYGTDSDKSKAYLAAKPHLETYFGMAKDKRSAWLRQVGDGQKVVLAYFRKYGSQTKTRKAVAYLAAKPYLEAYFGMPKDQRGAWLRHTGDGQRIVLDYFDKYAKQKDPTQHASDYLDVKATLDHYFTLKKDARPAFLKTPAGHPLLAYFKKYSKTHQYERAFYKLHPDLRHGTPEQAQRIIFWKQYFGLTPDLRPGFVHDHAEDYGVFIYGSFGEQHQEDQRRSFDRLAGKMTKRQEDYLFAKPLLDFYFQLPKDERPLFARANPEVSEYLARYPHGSPTGDAKLDVLVESYFKLPASSPSRSVFLRAHPDVQAYFDEHSTPAQVAMRNILTQYFAIPSGPDRSEFLAAHPEINAYFQKRRDQQAAKSAAYGAFDQSDPRLRGYFAPAQSLIEEAAWMRKNLRQSAINALSPEAIVGNRGRDDFAPSGGRHGDSRGSGVPAEADGAILDSRNRRGSGN